MKIYRVGGYVRDKLLGIAPHDCDYVVVGSSAAEMLSLGYRQIGSFFPVFLHPSSGEEYALARVERKSGQGHCGFSIEHPPTVSLEQDLERRDLSINAIAEDQNGQLIDPYGGIADLNNGILRHVSSAFSDDPLRILRVARFAAKLNFKVAPETLSLLKEMAQSREGLTISRERVVNELQRALAEPYSWRFFEVLAASANLAIFFPGLARAMEAKLQDFSRDLHGTTTIWQRYSLCAIYLGAAPYGELSLTTTVLDYLKHSQLLHQALAKTLNAAEILLLIKKISAVRNYPRFEHLTSNYSYYLQQHHSTYAMEHLQLLQQIVAALCYLPIAELQQRDSKNLAAAIHQWQLDTIHNFLELRI